MSPCVHRDSGTMTRTGASGPAERSGNESSIAWSDIDSSRPNDWGNGGGYGGRGFGGPR